MNTTEQAPFDPDYDADNPHLTEVPERFVYDAPLDEHGLAEMSIPERTELLDELDQAWQDHLDMEAELAAERAVERYFEEGHYR
jgi:preprotein translocase subunit SecA